MDKEKNRGSASVYMVCLLIPTVICMCLLIKYAQLICAKGMTADAAGLADNAVRASYNHAIMDGYGLFCYTKSAAELTDMANYYMDKSLPANMDSQVTASYRSGTSLNDNAVLLEQIDKYMSVWDKSIIEVDVNKLYTYCNMISYVPYYRDCIQNHYNNAVALNGVVEFTITGDEQFVRENAVAKVEADQFVLLAEDITLGYSGGATDRIAANNRVISYENDILDNISYGIDMLNEVEAYYQPLNNAITDMCYRTPEYRLAIYVLGNCSAFHSYGSYTITGRKRTTGDLRSVCAWSENEFIINGTNDSVNNANKVKYMIYESLFAEKLIAFYNTLYNDVDISEYAETIAGEHTAYIPVIKDELIVGVCARLAYEEMKNVYQYDGNSILSDYPKYMQVFDMIEIERNCDEALNRLKYIIELNARNSANAEAREFSFTNAWSEVGVTRGALNTDTSF